MIISYDFGIELGEYASLGKGNDFPIFDRCPSCNCIAHGNLHRNGYYWRYGINEDVGLCLPICRWRCLACKVNISILPDFLIPYFQHTLHTIVERVRSYLEGKRDADNRQQLSQVIKRFYHRLHWIHSFFVDIGHQLGLTKDIKKEALKYVKMIQDFGESPFFRRSWGHLSSYFMGTLILPYLTKEKHNHCPT
jgi:hypothetical protein